MHAVHFATFRDVFCSDVVACSGLLLLCFSAAVAMLLCLSLWLTGEQQVQQLCHKWENIAILVNLWLVLRHTKKIGKNSLKGLKKDGARGECHRHAN